MYKNTRQKQVASLHILSEKRVIFIQSEIRLVLQPVAPEPRVALQLFDIGSLQNWTVQIYQFHLNKKKKTLKKNQQF